MKATDVIVVTCCTHRSGLLDEYETQLREADIPFHVEPMDPLPDGPNSVTITRRLQFYRKMAMRFHNYKVIYATDAWDVLFFGTKEELIDKAPDRFLLGAERNCYPESNLASSIDGSTPWRYCNAGVAAAPPAVLFEWCEDVEKTTDLGILDQAWFNRRLAERSPLVTLDSSTNLFYVVSGGQEDGALRSLNRRPWNSLCNTSPNFFHFSGKASTEEVRSMLA